MLNVGVGYVIFCYRKYREIIDVNVFIFKLLVFKKFADAANDIDRLFVLI